MFTEIKNQFRRLWPYLLIIYAFVLAIMLSAKLWSILRARPMSIFTRDPLAVAGGKFYFGYVSNLGILLWASAVAVSLFCAVLCNLEGKKAYSRFLVYSGILTAIIMMDDLFMLHEGIYHSLFGLSEFLTFGIYASLIGIYLFMLRNVIIKTDYVLFLLALVFFALSFFFDTLAQVKGIPLHIYEDGFKLFGIASWCGYMIRSSFFFMRHGVA